MSQKKLASVPEIESLSGEQTILVNDMQDIKQIKKRNLIKNMIGGVASAKTVSEMTDTTKVYVYTGTESGYIFGNWYYWNDTAWTSGGIYNSTALKTDNTLTQEGQAADAKAVGEKIENIEGAISNLPPRDDMQWNDISEDEIFEIGDPDIDYAVDGLQGYFDLTEYENGYLGELINKANTDMTAKSIIEYIGENVDISKHGIEIGFVNGEFIYGKYHKAAAEAATESIQVYSTDQNRVFRNYPYTVEWYGKIKTEPFPISLYSTRGISYKYYGDMLGTGRGTLFRISDSKTLGTVGAVGQGTAQFLLENEIDYENYHHIVLEMGTNYQGLYIDNVKIGETTVANNDMSPVTSEVPAVVGGNSRIKMVRFYNRLLNDEEVSENYESVIKKYERGK